MVIKSLEQRDDEERAALVAAPAPPQQKKGSGGDDPEQQMDPDEHHNRTTATTKKESSSAAAAEIDGGRQPVLAAWWRRRGQKLVPTRGVGLAIAGLLVLALLVGGGTSRWGWIQLDYASSSFLLGSGGGGVDSKQQQQQRWPPHHVPSPESDRVPIPFSCGNNGTAAGRSSSPAGTTCRDTTSTTTTASSPSPSPSPSSSSESSSSSSSCPEYFRFIHSDLSPWRETGGITRETVELGRSRAAFRLVVVDGRAYVETYHRVFQTRDTFTQWGIAQLLARYPGRVPDLDLMFNCEDMPEVKKTTPSSPQPPPPPLFRYCKDDSTVDIVFPDWSFWGWPEVNIRPWAPLLEEMAAEAARLPWADRAPYAFWKGNPGVSGERAALLRCNDSAGHWKTRVFWQDWAAAAAAGFRDGSSDLAKQCRYRYKIFVRGRSWSVSQKYILACDSPVLLVATPFQDFFSRGLVAGRHYWPIDIDAAGEGNSKCEAIRFAVAWGNEHPEQARRMAEEGSGFARHGLAMDYVYDYMLHLLTQYAALLRYKPTVPENAVELCAEAVACGPTHEHEHGRELDFMMQSRERFVADYQPCTLPPPFTDDDMKEMKRRDKEVRDNVHRMMMASTTP